MRNILNLSLATSTLFLVTMQAQAATLIDNFNNGALELEVRNDNATNMIDTATQTGIDGVLGNSRNVTFTFDGVDPAVGVGRSFAYIDLFTVGNTFTHDNGSGVDSTVEIVYDGFSQIDLTTHGDRFGIDVIAFEPGGFSGVGIKVDDAFGGSDFIATTTLDPDPVFAFSDFSGIDFSAVTAITLQTKGLEGEDITLDNFRIEREQTPEPAAIIGLLASLGFGALSKKKKQA